MTSAIARIKAAISLPALAAEYGTLRKSGAQWLMSCPWHKESNPSCRVYETHVFCFTCQAHGDAIDLVAQCEGISKGAAIKTLSLRTGIPLDGKTTTKAGRVYDAQETQFALWWWKRTKDALAKRLTNYVIWGTEEQAEEAGLLWRQMAAVKRQDVRALAERNADAGDRADWRWDQEFEKAWLEMAKIPAQETTA